MRADVSHVIAAIEDAFRGVTLENGISLREAIVLDNYGTDAERQKARAQDEPHDWRSIPDDLIALHSDSLAFLDAKGMRFYLPAFMRFTLRHYQTSESPSIDSTINQLDCVDIEFSQMAADGVSERLFDRLTADQRAQIGRATGHGPLTTKFEFVRATRLEAKFGLLTEDQRDAVRCFLQFMASEGGGCIDDRIPRQALEGVWRKPNDTG